MEGVSHEACALAGTLALGKLIVLYDDNLISLDGPTELSYNDNVLERFEAYHWHTQRVADGNDLKAIEAAIEAAKAETGKPSLIAVRTVIGYGSPKAGTNKVHGEALGPADTAATKKFYGFPEDQSFYVPDDALKNWRKAVDRGATAEAEWKKLFSRYAAEFRDLAVEFDRTQKGLRKKDWEKAIPSFPADKKQATRNAGGAVMNADCRCRAGTVWRRGGFDFIDEDDFQAGREFPCRSGGAQCVLRRARVWHVRRGEWHGGAWRSGAVWLDVLYLLRLLQACAATGRVDADATRSSCSRTTRLGLGEDGPTHQPIEQLMMLRAVPGLTDFRPADANETAACWRLALDRTTPSFFALTRQDLPVIDATKHDVYGGVSKGAYVLEDAASRR